MKKTNKKGFTLAELLIVIAIIAVLIAIAIPTFSGALRNAKLQTDHANIRNAYAMVMAANLLGEDPEGATNKSTTYEFQKDGTIAAEGGSPYTLQVTAKTASPDECAASIVCKGVTDTNTHKETAKILIKYDNTKKEWTVGFSAVTP